MSTYQIVTGTFDLLPPEAERIVAVREALAAPLRRAGYGYVETPVFEQTALFKRGVGESTDIVTKEMFSWTDAGRRPGHPAPRGHRLHAARGPGGQPAAPGPADQGLLLRLLLPL